MFVYEKRLQYPIKIEKPNPRLASIIISQYGGPDGELGASLRYLSQRYTMPNARLKALLTDIGTEELAPRGYPSGYFLLAVEPFTAGSNPYGAWCVAAFARGYAPFLS